MIFTMNGNLLPFNYSELKLLLLNMPLLNCHYYKGWSEGEFVNLSQQISNKLSTKLRVGKHYDLVKSATKYLKWCK